MPENKFNHHGHLAARQGYLQLRSVNHRLRRAQDYRPRRNSRGGKSAWNSGTLSSSDSGPRRAAALQIGLAIGQRVRTRIRTARRRQELCGCCARPSRASKYSTLSGQMLALRSAPDEIQNGVRLLGGRTFTASHFHTRIILNGDSRVSKRGRLHVYVRNGRPERSPAFPHRAIQRQNRDSKVGRIDGHGPRSLGA